jgi:hypothetical protein
MKLPEQIYVWDEGPGSPDKCSLNLLEDGSRPVPEESLAKRVGVYKLIREVDLTLAVTETPVEAGEAAPRHSKLL